MSPLDLILPVGGIALIVLVVWLVGGLRNASIDDADTVRRHLALDHPEFEPGELRLAADKRSALATRSRSSAASPPCSRWATA